MTTKNAFSIYISKQNKNKSFKMWENNSLQS